MLGGGGFIFASLLNEKSFVMPDSEGPGQLWSLPKSCQLATTTGPLLFDCYHTHVSINSWSLCRRLNLYDWQRIILTWVIIVSTRAAWSGQSGWCFQKNSTKKKLFKNWDYNLYINGISVIFFKKKMLAHGLDQGFTKSQDCGPPLWPKVGKSPPPLL